ncbi:GNAT family N-acetyltransferase [Mangrovimicrobium sediminis]|uniref:GNAT family N-acetyltransferase n=1 Tax=Mangrovimicrobium sediminis TaxID=2562682 RepID=A0A4Z0M073_9GAMM|nr:GNAT family N-acetyltransferase [Haliea sp. SAOS-164]TGD72695.1 GNAT family N-acetyltransferase [Haliea sp. SAOS-164]
MDHLNIRPATAEDSALIYRFVRELAEYEREPDKVTTSEDELRDALFGPGARGAQAVICEIDAEPVGFALYFYNFSTWVGKYGIFLEDLYVSPEHRGCGAGKALLRHLAQKAVAEGCGRYEWNVLDWNEPSIRFYEACGAVAMDEWTGYRLAGEALRRFAQG